jgi:outer membrane cobalamin receptor
VGSIFNYKKLQASINIKSIGNLYKRVAANNLTELKENYALLNAGLAYHVYDNLKIYVNGDNLLNKNYEIILGYPMPGRAISIGANFRSSLE